MDLNILSKYINNNSVTSGSPSEATEKNTSVIENQFLNAAFSDELNIIKKNGFDSKIDAYKNTATGETTVAIGLYNESLAGDYVLVKRKWDDNKWDMTVLDNDDPQGNPIHNKIENSTWLASRGLEKTLPNQFSIKGLTIEEVLKLCE